MTNTCKYDFRATGKKANKFSSEKYLQAKGDTGTMFFSSKASPSKVRIVRAYLSADNWPASVDEYTKSAEIVVTNNSNNCEAFRITIEDARHLVEALPDIIRDAEQIKEALAKILPTEGDSRYEEVDDDDD